MSRSNRGVYSLKERFYVITEENIHIEDKYLLVLIQLSRQFSICCLISLNNRFYLKIPKFVILLYLILTILKEVKYRLKALIRYSFFNFF